MTNSTVVLIVIGQSLSALSVVRAPLLVGLIGAVGLAVPQQSHEILRVLALDFAAQQVPIWSALLFLMLTALAIWRMAHNLAETNTGARTAPVKLGILRWLPALCGALVPIGMACSLYLSSQEFGQQELPKEVLAVLSERGGPTVYAEVVAASQRLASGAAIAITVAVLIVVLAALLPPRLSLTAPPRVGTWDMLGRNMRRVMLGSCFALVICYAIFPVSVPQTFGSISIFLQFVLFLTFCASLITLAADRFQIPAITALLLWAVLLSSLELTDNHTIKPFAVEGWRKPVLKAFNEWYESRADRLEYESRGEQYPVILVTAAGGGIYAAQHAATVLSRLQDRCPNFAQHVFAISGVSGGSLGAAVFASLAKSTAPNGPRRDCIVGPMQVAGEMERRAGEVLKHDLLSPVIAAGLFPDFLQRFLPFPVQRFDRGRAFEAALEDAWERVHPGAENPFKKGFLAHWHSTDQTRALPALVLNTTSVSHGLRVPIQPFTTGAHAGWFGSLAGFDNFEEYIKEPMGNRFDITLGAAVSLSARFPWVMPPGSVEVVTSARALQPEGTDFWDRWFGKRTYRRLVDGGYFENSGMESVLDIVRDLREELDPTYTGRVRAAEGRTDTSLPTVSKKKFKLYILVVNSYQNWEDDWQGVSEVLSPIRTMLNTRQQRGYRALYSGLEELLLLEGRLWSAFALNQTDFRFPLGWQISDVTRRLIAQHSGEPSAVKLLPYGILENLGAVTSPRRAQRILGFLNLSDNSACEIVAALQPGPHNALKCNLPMGPNQ